MKDFKEKRNELKYEFYEDDSLSNEEKIEKYKQEILEYSNYVIILFWGCNKNIVKQRKLEKTY